MSHDYHVVKAVPGRASAGMAIYQNERFLFDDPFSKNVINRTKRYRLKRKQRSQESLCVSESDWTLRSQVLSQGKGEDLEPCDDVPVDPVDDYMSNGDDDLLEADDDDCLGANSPDDVYYVQYPDMEDEFEEQSQDLSDSEAESCPTDEQPEATPEEMLYPGSFLTVASSSVLIMKFKAKHKLSNDGLQDLLNLIKVHCPTPNKCITSSHLFNKQFGKNSAVSHYCNSCFQSIDADSQVCPNELCNNILSDSYSYFTEVPVIPQLKRLLERELIPTCVTTTVCPSNELLCWCKCACIIIV